MSLPQRWFLVELDFEITVPQLSHFPNRLFPNNTPQLKASPSVPSLSDAALTKIRRIACPCHLRFGIMQNSSPKELLLVYPSACAQMGPCLASMTRPEWRDGATPAIRSGIDSAFRTFMTGAFELERNMSTFSIRYKASPAPIQS
jgi:hypothetical protein